MSDTNALVQNVLEEAGYAVWLITAEGMTAVCFEDEAIMGFVSTFPEPAELLTRWRGMEGQLLARHAARFHAAEEKAWNVYSVFLAIAEGSEDEKRAVTQIDEDLERTRKIAACGVAGREAVVAALLPILPIQHRPVLEDDDLTARLKRRIAAIAPAAVDAALNDDVAPVNVIPLLGPA